MVSKKQQREAAGEQERPRQEQIALEELAAYRWDFHPTKQYVRREGWLQYIKDYVERRRAMGVTRLKYFTLPGRNALDVGMLYQEGLLERKDDGFPTLAICDREHALEVVRNIGPLLAYAQDHLQKVVWGHGRDGGIVGYFPYDVINLDFCGPLLQPGNNYRRISGTVHCIKRIFALQRRCGFLLLLTVRAGESMLNKKAKAVMRRSLQDNINGEEEFRCKYAEHYGSLDLAPCLKRFTAFSQLVIPKIIAHIGAFQNHYRVIEHFAAKYDRPDTTAQSYDMICHIFELEPIGRQDKNKFKSQSPYELDHISTRTVEQAMNEYRTFISGLVQRPVIDVDQHLADHPGLAEELEAEAKGLANWWERSE